MTTDNDILAALKGQHAPDGAIAEAFGRALSVKASEDTAPPQRRGDAFEATAIWAAKEATATATAVLAEAIMRANGTKGIYEAEAEAKAIAAEAYEEVAKGSPHEVTRQEAVARIVSKMASQFEHLGREASRPKQTEANSPRQTPPATSRKRVMVTEIASGRITAVLK